VHDFLFHNLTLSMFDFRNLLRYGIYEQRAETTSRTVSRFKTL